MLVSSVLNFARAIYSLLDLRFSSVFGAVKFQVSPSEVFSAFLQVLVCFLEFFFSVMRVQHV